MARIVLCSWGSYGDVFPYLGLALALRERGHVPVLAMPAFYRATVEQQGIAFHAVRPDIDPSDTELIARIMDPWRGAEVIFRELIMPALRDSLADLGAASEGADLVLSHPVTFAASMAAEQRGIPWLATVLAPLSFFSNHDLPVPPPMPWFRHTFGFGLGWAKLFTGLARRKTYAWGAPVHQLRAELGLRAVGNPVFEGQFSPHGNIALFSPLIGAPQPDWPARTQATGFVFYNGPEALGEALEAFLARGPAPIVFTLGSSAVFSAGQFYEESIAAVKLLGRRAVLLAGPDAVLRLAPLLTEDIIAVDFAPHQLLFPRAAAVVHQAGIGTLAQGLRSGRPMLCVPHANDQPDNAFRAEKLGCARMLSPGRYRAARVADELQRLLDAPAYGASAANIRMQLNAEDGTAQSCMAIEAALPA